MANTNNRGGSTTLFIIITALFCFWGLANNMTGVLQKAFGQILEIGSVQAVLIQSAFYAAYICFALPATYYIFRNSYKGTTLVGLLMYAVGAMLFFPASSVGSVYFYILAIYIMAGGCTVLETVANPYILSLEDDPDRAIRKLNLAQSFNPLGSLAGIMLGNVIVINNLSAETSNPEIMQEELDAITMLYAVIGEVLMIFMVLLLFVSMPVSSRLKQSGSQTLGDLKEGLRRIWQLKQFRYGTLAMFLYVGAQSGVWGYIVPAVESIDPAISSSTIYIIAMVAFAVFRFIFTWLMGTFHWNKLLISASVAASVMCLAVVFGSGILAIAAMVMASAMMSMMFPTIFGSAVENTGNDMQVASSVLIMAISGGLAIPPLQSLVAGAQGPLMSYIIPALCFMGIAAYGASLILTDRKK